MQADIAAEAATGKAFLHSHTDVNGRPVIVVRAARHITGGRPVLYGIPASNHYISMCSHLFVRHIL